MKMLGYQLEITFCPLNICLVFRGKLTVDSALRFRKG
jgi:hypothetical protein